MPILIRAAVVVSCVLVLTACSSRGSAGGTSVVGPAGYVLSAYYSGAATSWDGSS
jgi:uncharacterized membrane protein